MATKPAQTQNAPAPGAQAGSAANGLLSVEVTVPPIVAGETTTVSLIIRNPFSEPVTLEPIQAPWSAPLIRKQKDLNMGSGGNSLGDGRWQRMKSFFSAFRGIQDSNVVFDPWIGEASSGDDSDRVIGAQQEHVATFALKTEDWLLIKPKEIRLNAFIKYKIGSEMRGQVVPFTISVRPPLKSIVIGTIFGGVVGFAARQLNSGNLSIAAMPSAFEWANILTGILGIVVMAFILSMLLSRQESSKGFVTLEDFFGAFVVGAALGYAGTEFFESVFNENIGDAAPKANAGDGTPNPAGAPD